MASRRFPTAYDEQAIRQLIQQFSRTLGNKEFCCKIVNGSRPRPGSQVHPIVPQDPVYPEYPDPAHPNGSGQPDSGSGQPGNQGPQYPQGPDQLPNQQPGDIGYPMPEGFEWIDRFSGLIQYIVSTIVENVMSDVIVQGKEDLKGLLSYLLEAFRGKDEQSLEKILKDCLNGKMPKTSSTEGNSSINGMQDEMLQTILDYVMMVFMFEVVRWCQYWITSNLPETPQSRLFGGKKKRPGNHGNGGRGRGGILQNILKATGIDM